MLIMMAHRESVVKTLTQQPLPTANVLLGKMYRSARVHRRWRRAQDGLQWFFRMQRTFPPTFPVRFSWQSLVFGRSRACGRILPVMAFGRWDDSGDDLAPVIGDKTFGTFFR